MDDIKTEQNISITDTKKILEQDKYDNLFGKCDGIEQEKAACDSTEEILGKECEINKYDNLFGKHDGIYEIEQEKASCDSTEEISGKECEKKVDTILLPSEITDREEFYFPHKITNEDPNIYGKWLIFTNGNLKLQDHLWVQLQELLKSGDLILLGSSTAKLCANRGPFQGIIKCYTSKDLNVIRHAGISIQNILKDQTILDYKTNEASQNNLYRVNGNRFITKFMLTVNGKLYKKDKLCRWIQVTDEDYHNFKFDESLSISDHNCGSTVNKRQRLELDSHLLPSSETRKKVKKYIYPDGTCFNELSNILCLFCNVTDADNSGLTELDRVWNKAKTLCDEKLFRSVTCETYAFKGRYKRNFSRRTVMCELNNFDIGKIIEHVDKLRERLSYNMFMYFKTFLFNYAGKPEYRLKYLYTDDRELYEFTEDKWKLLKRI